MDTQSVLSDAMNLGGVIITPENKTFVEALVKAGKLVKPTVIGLTQTCALVPNFPESAWVVEVRVRPDHVEMMDGYYSPSEATWAATDYLGNPMRQAHLTLQDAVIDLNPRHFDAEYEVRVRRVGTSFAAVVIAGKAPVAEVEE